MDVILLSVNAVVPLFLVIGLGCLIGKKGLLTEENSKQLSTIAFRILMPFHLFNSIYSGEKGLAVSAKLLFWIILIEIVSFFAAFLLAKLISGKRAVQGSLQQGIFRSNMLVFGLPIANAILDSDGVALFTVALLLILPMQTLGSILGQELFGEQRETVDWGKAVFHSFVNTNTLGMVLGLIFVLAGIRLPECVMDGITDIGKIASPLCLLLIGAGFDLSDIRGYAKELILGVVSRLFVIPAVFFPLIIRDGFLFSEKFILLLVCCAPTATSIYTIVEDGGLDRKLAKEIIIISTLASLLSLTFWVFVLQSFGM